MTTGCSRGFSGFRRLHAQGRWRYSRLRQFESVPDEPAFKRLRFCLDMKLQAKDMRADGESLRGAMLCRSQPLRFRRQIKVVAMPVQHVHAFEWREDRAFARLGQIDRCIADLFRRTRRDARPSAAAINCAPRHIPSVGRRASSRARSAGISSRRNGYSSVS